jgi:hypothetical protein
MRPGHKSYGACERCIALPRHHQYAGSVHTWWSPAADRPGQSSRVAQGCYKGDPPGRNGLRREPREASRELPMRRSAGCSGSASTYDSLQGTPTTPCTSPSGVFDETFSWSWAPRSSRTRSFVTHDCFVPFSVAIRGQNWCTILPINLTVYP